MNLTLFTAVFLCIGWIVEVAGNEHPTDCCYTVTNTRIPVNNIVKHSIQEPPICPIKAVRFYTKKNKVICSDPNNDWAKNVIKSLSPTTKPTQCHTKTIQTTTHKTPEIQTETSTSTTVQRTVTEINTSGPETSTITTIPTSETGISTSTITTSVLKTSRSTTVKTIKSSQMETESNKRSPEKSEPPPQTTLNTMTTCRTDEPMTPTKEKKPKTSSDRVTSTTPARRTKPSKLKIKARKKSKKEFRKLQINSRLNSRN